MRIAPRVPLYTRVTTDLADVGALYSWNISEGGMQLRAAEASVGKLQRDMKMLLSFVLPDASGGSPIEVRGTVMWLDSHARDHHGRRSIAFGVKFDAGQDTELDRARAFVETFRYRVAVMGFEDPNWVYDAVGPAFELVPCGDDAEGSAVLASPLTGLLLLSEGREPSAGAERLQRLLQSELEVAPPIIYLGSDPNPALQQQIVSSGRVAFLPVTTPPFAVHALALRLIEFHVLEHENAQLTAEVARTLSRLKDENQILRQRLVEPARLPGIIGQSESMRRVFELAERVAPLDTTVLIRGESGTGKELFARALHGLSPRAERAFVAQNCAALPDTLLDSELFGHTRGSFTGAIADRAGLFETARGGTVFLDEVAEMTPSMQAKLLRVLEAREVRRIGATRSTPIDIRLICATHRDLQAMVQAGTFRQDLFYRFAGFVLQLPPLSQRRDDVQSLAVHFLAEYGRRHHRAPSGFAPAAMRVLEEFPWPGNVRELAHVIERLVVLCEPGRVIEASLVREAVGLAAVPEVGPTTLPGGTSLDDAVTQFERSLIIAHLDQSGGVLSKAARELNVDRTTLSKRCKRLGIRVGS